VKYDPEKHHRRSIRLKDYNYTRPGGYFITLCTQNHDCLFGLVTDDQMILNDAGEMSGQWVIELEKKFPDILCDRYIIMPNHFASALGLKRVLDLGSYKTAWAWLHKLRRAMVTPGRNRLSGIIEVDESYIGAELW